MPELCRRCGKPLGSGTLLDFSPEPPAVNTSLFNLYAAKVGCGHDSFTMSAERWAEFAGRYRCPVCAEAVPRDA